MYNPKVSIIVPVYNVAEYLPECLDSLINQTLSEIEIICIDDKSTDNSAEILKEYVQKDSRIKVIFNEKNSGTGSSRNKGLDVAMGEYIGFVDSDDWVSLDFFEILYKRVKEENAEISATSKIINYFSPNRQIKAKTGLEQKKYINTTKNKEKALYATMAFCNKIYSNEFINKNNIKFQVNSYAEDVNFSVPSYFLSDKIAISDKPIYFYRQNRAGSAVTGLKNLNFLYPLLPVIKNCYSKLEESHLSKLQKIAWGKNLAKRFINDLILIYNRVKFSQRKQLVDIINNELKDINIMQSAQQNLFKYKIMIILLIILELLTFKAKKIHLSRQKMMETALILNQQIKLLNNGV